MNDSQNHDQRTLMIIMYERVRRGSVPLYEWSVSLTKIIDLTQAIINAVDSSNQTGYERLQAPLTLLLFLDKEYGVRDRQAELIIAFLRHWYAPGMPSCPPARGWVDDYGSEFATR